MTNTNIYTYSNATEKMVAYAINGTSLEPSEIVIPKTFDTYKDSGIIKSFTTSKQESNN